MRRNVERLAAEVFDVLIIGGGIHGAWTALRAARAGYKVALIDRGDFGTATSANSLRILHGGLRYLQNLDLKRMRYSIRARREFGRLSPHLVRPLPCRIELSAGGLRSPWVMGPALAINDLVSFDRNRGLDPGLHLPLGRVTSARECREALSSLVASDCHAGALWWDAFACDGGRLVLEPILAADLLGAVVANQVAAERYIIKQGSVRGVVATDRLKGRQFEIEAKATINVTGPWACDLSNASSLPAGFAPATWVGAMNVVFSRELGIRTAVGLSAKSRSGDSTQLIRRATRDVFFVPDGAVTVAGTDYHTLTGTLTGSLTRPPSGLSESMLSPPDGAVGDFVHELSRVAPTAQLTRADVAHVQWGVLPGDDHSSGQPRKEPVFATDSAVGTKGLLVLITEKLTSAPELSLRTLRWLRERAPRTNQPLRPDRESVATTTTFSGDVSAVASSRLARRYGLEWRAILAEAIDEQSVRSIAGTDALPIEVAHAIGSEMANSLPDVLHRLGLVQHGYPGSDTVNAVAELAAKELGWDADRTSQEVTGVNDHFAMVRRWVQS